MRRRLVMPGSVDAATSGSFAALMEGRRDEEPLRAAITAAYRRPEPDCVAALLEGAALPPDAAARAEAQARTLVEALREKAEAGGVEALVQEYSLSSQEGVALMCLAEALLRIPDIPTRDALIRDKIAGGDWRTHVGHSPSLFVNAATWGLVVTGALTATADETGLASALARLIRRGGEPLIRAGLDLSMRMMGEQFVLGETIAEALARSRAMEARRFRYSYDMLGEAAVTAEDAERYFAAYEGAIHAIGAAAGGRGVIDGPGISVKLSALHPRYVPLKRERVLGELLGRIRDLAMLSRRYGIGLNIDAEEADRLGISLDILEALAVDPALSDWEGLGFVVQAYGKRCPFVVDWLVDLARRTGRRLMVRLVKGAYWDTEIKRAQVDGLTDFPVFTRKVHTDVSYLACARKLLDARAFVFPQFATHNAQTVAAVLEMAGPRFAPSDYEFQCLHGMGEPLYEEVVGPEALDRPCRIYAPVGTHETLLPYLVRRLLENGANSSFVHRIRDEAVPIEDLLADPVGEVRAMAEPGAPHPGIKRPHDLFADRPNSAGLDLTDEAALVRLAQGAAESTRECWRAGPVGLDPGGAATEERPIRNPADRRDIVGLCRDADAPAIETALAVAAAAAPSWAATPVEDRAAGLARAADAMEKRLPVLASLIVREAGRSFPGAISEVREAVDFLRYYGAEANRTLRSRDRSAVGPVLCISPWNFPLAIFIGQVAAALAAGNPVLAKPAEDTPLVAAEAVRILYASGIPHDVLRLLPGDGNVGDALVRDPRVRAVLFTGSTATARSIQRRLARRLNPGAQPVPLIAETGGQNALVVDSSALAEQVVGDAVASAFDSAGQRCSALRILCLQDDVADRILSMLKGALLELDVGNPGKLSIDMGPVISAKAREAIERHVETMQARGHRVTRLPLPPGTEHGTFVAPTIIEIDRVSDVEQEVFGPVLHVLRFARPTLARLLQDIEGTGCGLTFGLHTRIDETIEHVTAAAAAGNLYINRNIIGAVVGVQPFGGRGLSGTGPKAGGPLYLGRLVRDPPDDVLPAPAIAQVPAAAKSYADWLEESGKGAIAAAVRECRLPWGLGAEIDLPGPVGERNRYSLRPRGRIAALCADGGGLSLQVGAILATGNVAVAEEGTARQAGFAGLPPPARDRIELVPDWRAVPELDGVLFDGEPDELLAVQMQAAERDGPIVPVIAYDADRRGYDLLRLVEERTVSVNTAAAGGNAHLMAIV